jgi:hypothetical protein
VLCSPLESAKLLLRVERGGERERHYREVTSSFFLNPDSFLSFLFLPISRSFCLEASKLLHDNDDDNNGKTTSNIREREKKGGERGRGV